MTTLVPSPITGYAFTPEDSRKGALVANARHQERLNEAAARRWFIQELTKAWQEGDIGEITLTAAKDLTVQIMDGMSNVDINNSLDVARLAQAVEVLFKVHRLATGQSTSNAAHASLDVSELEARKAELLARLSSSTGTQPE